MPANHIMTSTAPREHEAKFQPARPDSLAALLHILHQEGYTVVEQGELRQHDLYLDTPAYDLLRAGFVVRLRQDDGPPRIGLKSLSNDTAGAIQHRIDLEAPLDADDDGRDPATWTSLLRDELAPLLPLLADLRPLAIIRQTRHKRVVQLPPAVPLAEWSLDDVEVYSPTGADAPLVTFQELELELLDDARSDEFASLVARVRDVDGLQALTTSKLERALPALVSAAHGTRAAIAPDMPLGEACRLVLHEQLVRLLLLEHSVRAGIDPEAVHDARVAIRRARAALRLLGSPFRRSIVKHTSRGLARLGRKLGAVRDLDVGLENLQLFRKELPKPQRKALKVLRAALEARRHTARQELLAYLDGEEHRAFLVEALALATTPGAGLRRLPADGPEVLPTQVRHTLPSIVLRTYEEVRAYETVFGGDTTPPLETYHALRIQAKYLRYSLEFARLLLGEPGERLIAQLKELQEELGRLNDAHVEQVRLQTWSGDFVQDSALRLRLQAVEDEIAARCAAAPALLARFVAPETRALLGQALARI